LAKPQDLRDMTDDELEHELKHGGNQGSPVSPLLKDPE
jgi:hypothetical protein